MIDGKQQEISRPVRPDPLDGGGGHGTERMNHVSREIRSFRLR